MVATVVVDDSIDNGGKNFSKKFLDKFNLINVLLPAKCPKENQLVDELTHRCNHSTIVYSLTNLY